jgi:predicted nicotinamide N-methyase
LVFFERLYALKTSSLRLAIQARESGNLDSILDLIISQRVTTVSLQQLLVYLQADRDCVLYSARAHLALTRNIGYHFDNEGEDIAAACVTECARILSIYGLGFPLESGSKACVPSPILDFDFSSVIKILEEKDWIDLQKTFFSTIDIELLNKNRKEAAQCCSKISVRAVPSYLKRQESQNDVGQLLWPAAPPFCRWLVAYSPILFPSSSHRILEIGSGMGLSGCVASRLARFYTNTNNETEIVLTDFNPVVLHNLEQNIRLNDDTSTIIEKLDWDEFITRSEFDSEITLSNNSSTIFDKPFDIILGSDMICSNSDSHGVAKVLYNMLSKPNGIAVFCLAPEDVRWGVGKLSTELKALGMKHSCQQLNSIFVCGEEQGTIAGGYENRLNIHIATW